eukprot:1787513-Amphidinium_carterae.1
MRFAHRNALLALRAMHLWLQVECRTVMNRWCLHDFLSTADADKVTVMSPTRTARHNQTNQTNWFTAQKLIQISYCM